MRRVYKYPINILDYGRLTLPGSDPLPLTVQLQHGQAQLWALVEPTPDVATDIIYRIAGTGHNIEGTGWRYLSTFQLMGGDLVFHVFWQVAP